MPDPLPPNRVVAFFAAVAVMYAAIVFLFFTTAWLVQGAPGPFLDAAGFILLMTLGAPIASLWLAAPSYYFSRYMARSQAVDGPIVEIGRIVSGVHTETSSWYTWTRRIVVADDAPGWLVDVEGIRVRLHVPEGSGAGRRLQRLAQPA